MGEITINLKGASLAVLSELAKANNKSLEVETLEILESALAQRLNRLELLKRAQRISAMTPKGIKQSDSTDFIREERNR